MCAMCEMNRNLNVLALFILFFCRMDEPPKSGLKVTIFISQSKHMLWVLKRTISMRRFF